MPAISESGSAFCRPAIHRRKFLQAMGGLGMAAAFGVFLKRAANGKALGVASGYGRLRPVRDETTGLELLQLPEGFRYLSFGWTGDGRLFPLATNSIVLRGGANGLRGDFRGEERAGVNFSADGRRLFANIMAPGITFAITGGWGQGLL